MKRLLMTLALTSALSVAAMAGDMHGDGAPVSAGTPQGNSTSPSPVTPVLGDMHTTDAAQPVFEDALSALLSVLGLVF